jgi:hypothetical protein
LYVFSNDPATIEKVESNTSSGAFVSNDTMVHVSRHTRTSEAYQWHIANTLNQFSKAGCNTLLFGGVGPSGIGGYVYVV